MINIRHRAATSTAVVALVLFAALTGVGGWLPGMPQWGRLVLHFVTMLLTFIAAGVYVSMRARLLRVLRENDLTWQPGTPTPHTNPPTLALQLVEISQSLKLPTEVLRAFTDTICNPARVRRSVEEIIDLHPDHSSRTLHVQFELALRSETSALISILRERKGHLEDNVEVLDSAGNHLQLLSRMDSMGLLWAAVRDLVKLAYFPTGVTVHNSADVAAMELYYSAHIALPRGSADVLTKPACTIVNPQAAATLDMLLGEMADNYPVVVIVPAELLTRVGESVTVRITHRSTSPVVDMESSNARGWRRVSNNIRRWLFISNLQFQINAAEALRSSDYNLTVNAPAGAVTGTVRFADGTSAILKDPNRRGRLTDFHVRTPKSRQQNFAHLYTRDLSRSSYAKPRYYVTFFEDLPGAIGRAAIAAWALAWVVWISSISLSFQGNDMTAASATGTTAGPDSLALVLTLQGGLLAWITTDLLRRPRGLSLVARASMLTTGALSLVAALSFVMTLSERTARWNLPEEWSYWYLTDTIWSAVLATTVVNAGFITLTLFVRRQRGGM